MEPFRLRPNDPEAVSVAFPDLLQIVPTNRMTVASF